MRISEKAEGQESLHNADGPTQYLSSAAVTPVQKTSLETTISKFVDSEFE